MTKDMKYEKWKNHLEKRSDCTTYLTHLTRRSVYGDALHTLYKILDEKKIIGSTNYDNKKGFKLITIMIIRSVEIHFFDF